MLDVEKRWTKPELRFVKLNVDAAYHTDEGAGTATAILRDIRGNFIAASSIYYPIAANVVTSEAMAMRDGLAFANTMGFHAIEAESDSLEIINFCTRHDHWWDAATTVYAEILDLATDMGKVNFNSVAHELAQFSFHNKLSSIWGGDPSSCLLSKLADDVNIFLS